MGLYASPPRPGRWRAPIAPTHRDAGTTPPSPGKQARQRQPAPSHPASRRAASPSSSGRSNARPAHPSPVRGPGIRFKTAIAEPRPARLRSQSPKSEDRDARSLLKSENVRRRRHRHRRQHFIDTVFQVGDQSADLLSGPWEAKRSRRFRTVGKVLDLSRTDLESSSSEPGFSIISTRVMENLNVYPR